MRRLDLRGHMILPSRNAEEVTVDAVVTNSRRLEETLRIHTVRYRINRQPSEYNHGDVGHLPPGTLTWRSSLCSAKSLIRLFAHCARLFKNNTQRRYFVLSLIGCRLLLAHTVASKFDAPLSSQLLIMSLRVALRIVL